MGKNKDKNLRRKQKQIQDKKRREHSEKHSRKTLNLPQDAVLRGYTYDQTSGQVVPAKVERQISVRHLSQEKSDQPPIWAWRLDGIPISSSTYEEILKEVGSISSRPTLAFDVFRLEFLGKIFYICLSGGDLVGGEPRFTLFGRGAYEALCQIQSEYEPVIKYLCPSNGSIESQIRAILSEQQTESRICLLGDMAKTLDALIYPVFEGIIFSYTSRGVYFTT